MKIDGVDFADGFVESFKTEDEFLDEMFDEGYEHIYAGPDRQDRLKKVYALHHMKTDPEQPQGSIHEE